MFLLVLVAATALGLPQPGMAVGHQGETVTPRPFPPFHLKCERNFVGLTRSAMNSLSRQFLFATDNASPQLSWSLAHRRRHAHQSAFRVIVAQNAELNDPVVWDSGTVFGSVSSTKYAGPDLHGGVLYFWKVSWRDDEGRWSGWSEETGHFLTGVLRMRDWAAAKWIAAPNTFVSAPLISRQFTVDREQLTSAVLIISGLGFSKVYVNGVDLNSRYDPPIALTPGWTNYEVRVPYTVYNITNEVSMSNEAIIEVILGLGWRDTGDFSPRDKLPHPDAVPRVVRAILNITYTNNSVFSLVTDESWNCIQTVYLQDSIYNGETFNSSYTKGSIEPVVVTEGPAGVMYLPPIPPIAEMETEMPVHIYHLQSDPNKQIVDFANNSAGVCRISVKDLKPGMSITLHHAEVPLHPPYGPMNGSLYYGNLRSAEQLDTYYSNGSSNGYQPSFTYHGFRYVEVSGYPQDLTPDDVQKVVVHTNLIRNVIFNTSNALLNTIQENCVRGQLSNLMSVPTDCCQRDERLGWMGDAGLSSDSMALNFHMDAFHPHFIQLISDELINGTLPDVVPFYRYGTRPADPSWGATLPQILWVLFHYYGDTSTVKQYFPVLTQYLDFMTAQVEKSGMGKLYGYYGDWVPPPPYPKVDISFTSSFSYLNGIKQGHCKCHEVRPTLSRAVSSLQQSIFQ